MNKLEYIHLVKLTLKRKKEPFAASTFWASDVSYHPDELYSGSPHVYSGLMELGGFAQRMGEVLPLASSGVVVFNNNRGSLASDKRWSDLLHHYAFYWQVVEVYLFSRLVDSVGDSSDLVLQFKGRIDDTKVNNQQKFFEVGVTSNDLSRAKVNYVLNSDDNPNTPDGNLGYPLPIVFGENVQVPAVLTNATPATSSYAYATNLSSSFTNAGVQKLYVKAERDNYIQFTPVASTTTPIINFGLGSDWFLDIWEGEKELGFKVKPGQNSTLGQVLVGCNFYLSPSVAPPFTEYLGEGFVCSVYSKGTNGYPDKLITSDFLEIRNSNSQIEYVGNIPDYNADNQHVYRFKFEFKEPVILSDSVFITLGKSMNDTNTWLPIKTGSSIGSLPSYQYFLRFDTASPDYDPAALNSNWNISVLDSNRLAFELYGVAFADSPTGLSVSAKGFGGSSFSVSRRAQTLPDLSELEFIAEIDGLKDDSSGTITGTNNQLITNARDAIKLLYYRQNNNSLTGFNLISSSVDSALFGNVLNGATSKETTYRDLISEIAFSSASKLFPTLTGGYNLWSYGSDIAEQYELSESDCKLNDYYTIGKGDLINSVTINFDKRRIPLTNQNSQRESRETRNYKKSKIYEFGTSAIGDIGYSSENLYFKEELNSFLENVDWFSENSNADRLALYMLSTKTEEKIICNVSVPTLKNNYQNIKIGDIIRLSHIDLPYEWGTASDSVEKLPSFEGVENSNFNFGYSWRRARDLLTRVIAISPEIRFDKNSEPIINLVLIEILEKEAVRP